MQLHFDIFKNNSKRRDCFGGSLLGKSHPKRRRPLDSKRPIHLVLKANASVLRNNQVARNIVHGEVQRWSKRCGVTIYRWANAGNHLHLAIRLGRVHQWPKFIRGLTGSIARKFQTARLTTAMDTHGNGRNLTHNRTTTRTRFWHCRPFTRIVRSWQKAFKTLLEYIRMNQLEAQGILNPKDRDLYYSLRAQLREDADGPPSAAWAAAAAAATG